MAVRAATLAGTEVHIDDEALEALRMSVRGDVLLPGDAGYSQVRAAYNLMHPGHPAIVVRARGVADVVDAVNFAREQGLLLAIRSGGHSVAGLSSVDGGMLLSLELMDGVDVDLDAGVARVQGGALWGDVDRETQKFDLVAPGGVVSHTGVAGLTLGGGEGWVRRKYGLSIDSLVSAQVVTADGRVLTASADKNPDLFWALRGGGGNFGVVTQFTFKLHPLPATVAFAGVFYPASEMASVFKKVRDWTKTAPDEISLLVGCTTLPSSEHTPPQIHNTPMCVVGAVYAGDPDEGMKVIQPLREMGNPLADISGPIPFVGVQGAFDEFFQLGVLRSYWKSTYVNGMTDEIIDIVAGAAQNRPHDRVFCVNFFFGGQINRVGAEDTAYSERTADWMVSVDGNWYDAEDDEKVISWVRDLWGRVHAKGTGVTYLNFTGISDETTDVGVDDAFGRNLKRLAEIKKKYDPQNFFRLNNNIKPA